VYVVLQKKSRKLFWALSNQNLWIFPSISSNGLRVMTPAQLRESVDDELEKFLNRLTGVEYNPEILDDLKRETIEVHGGIKDVYQFLGKVWFGY
jgi:hypothetical protein